MGKKYPSGVKHSDQAPSPGALEVFYFFLEQPRKVTEIKANFQEKGMNVQPFRAIKCCLMLQ